MYFYVCLHYFCLILLYAFKRVLRAWDHSSLWVYGCMQEGVQTSRHKKDYVNTSSGAFSSFLNCTTLCLHVCYSIDDGSDKHRKWHFFWCLSGHYCSNQSCFWEQTVIVLGSQGGSTQQPLRWFIPMYALKLEVQISNKFAACWSGLHNKSKNKVVNSHWKPMV